MNLATLMTIEGDYLQTLGVPLLCGRFFAQAESSSWGVIQRIWPAIFDLLRLGRFAEIFTGDTSLRWAARRDNRH